MYLYKFKASDSHANSGPEPGMSPIALVRVRHSQPDHYLSPTGYVGLNFAPEVYIMVSVTCQHVPGLMMNVSPHSVIFSKLIYEPVCSSFGYSDN